MISTFGKKVRYQSQMFSSRRCHDGSTPMTELDALKSVNKLLIDNVRLSLGSRTQLLHRVDDIYAQILALADGTNKVTTPPTEPERTSKLEVQLIEKKGAIGPRTAYKPTVSKSISQDRNSNENRCTSYDVEHERTRRQFRARPMPTFVAQRRVEPTRSASRDSVNSQRQSFEIAPKFSFGDASPTPPTPFKARPVPARIFSDAYRQRRNAEEEVRQLRIKARSEEMLRCSASPFSPRMPTRHRSKTVTSVPMPPPPTKVALPTTLQSRPSHARRSRSCPCAERHQEKLVARPVPAFSFAEVKLNATAHLRQQQLLERQREESRRQEAAEEAERLRRIHRTRLIEQMDSACRPPGSIRDKLRAHRLSAMLRAEEYTKELREIDARVRANPLLVERQALHGARCNVEHRYQRKLRELGLSEDFIEDKAAMHVRKTSPFDTRTRSRSASTLRDQQSDTESAHGSFGDLSIKSGQLPAECDVRSASAESSEESDADT